jgi:hypothetical protein
MQRPAKGRCMPPRRCSRDRVLAMAENSKPRSQGLVSQVLSGLATGLFNVPSGLVYAQLAGVNPIYGLYSGIVATLVAALSTGTVLMISTITSAIALATGSVLQVAGIQDSQLPQAIFTLTFLAGAIMLALGLLRLGSIVNFISNAMTGFVGGMALLIILGQEQHLTGYSPTGANQVQKTIDWLQNLGQWNLTTLGIGLAVIVLMVVLQRIKPIAHYASSSWARCCRCCSTSALPHTSCGCTRRYASPTAAGWYRICPKRCPRTRSQSSSCRGWISSPRCRRSTTRCRLRATCRAPWSCSSCAT